MTTQHSALNSQPLRQTVADIVEKTPVYDIHTHLYDPAFGGLLLWGIDELLTYHYLVAEGFRYSDIPYDKFWALPKTAQADLIWDALSSSTTRPSPRHAAACSPR